MFITGHFTIERNIRGLTPREIESRLGFRPGRLISGARILLLLREPTAEEYENFMLDVTRGRIKLTKATYQNRARQVVILMRLDLDGPPHRNPNDEVIPCPHLHVYREGYGDKWAVPAPVTWCPNPADLSSTFEAFMRQCNITEAPIIQKGLF